MKDILADFRSRGLAILDKRSRCRRINEASGDKVVTNRIVVDGPLLDWRAFVQEFNFLVSTLERLIEFKEKYEDQMGPSEYRVFDDAVHEAAVRCSAFLSEHEPSDADPLGVGN